MVMVTMTMRAPINLDASTERPCAGARAGTFLVQPVQLIADSTADVHPRWVQRAALLWGDRMNLVLESFVWREASLARSFGRASRLRLRWPMLFRAVESFL